ncbi:metallophosphoesterase family protein [Methylobacterium crusticola]|uniref:metallophosphoesterase family protein n=1 Tax=Methylobacterium crusticola TaxID=1697972 RepID=UPI001396C25E|nr:metallophosphoesterase family protein [Methylobacterium crusticola]
MLTYAIGDIHGCRQEFESLLAMIRVHAGEREHRIITLGDAIDRGPDSKGVLDIVMRRPDIVALRGNHEQMLLEARHSDTGEQEARWLQNGGSATLRSFGASGIVTYSAHDIPERYVDFCSGRLLWYYEDAQRIYVHAGMHPSDTSISQADKQDLIWIRSAFLFHAGRFPKYVVHGHTPTANGVADIRHNRCNLDTCCFSTGVLTCAVFDESQEQPIDLLRTPRWT